MAAAVLGLATASSNPPRTTLCDLPNHLPPATATESSCPSTVDNPFNQTPKKIKESLLEQQRKATTKV
jgi:hypothetical protein